MPEIVNPEAGLDRSVGLPEHVSPAGTRIDEVSPAVIPHSEFANRRWLYTTDTLWYYHAPKAQASQRIRNDDFDLTVDPLLRSFVKRLHDAGMWTLPSCQGHFYGEEHYRQIWDKLQREAEDIRSNGLQLCDDETGENLLYQNPQYELPWNSFQCFYTEGSAGQTMGYLSFVMEDKQLCPVMTVTGLDLPNAVIHCSEHKGGLRLDILVQSPNEQEQAESWRQVEEAVMKILT